MKKLFFLLPLCLILLVGCIFLQDQIDELAERLADLAYPSGNEYDNRVYIMEDGKFTPYLVLTDDYNGHCLLLREYLLKDKQPFNNPHQFCPSYYENSSIDLFLNNEFYTLFSDYVSDQIVESSIEITTKDSIAHSGEETLTILRKIFLLSYSELNYNARWVFVREGNQLSYFAENEKRVAFFEDGPRGAWWLRTPDTLDRYSGSVIDDNGIAGSAGLLHLGGTSHSGVRPAFCLPGELPVAEANVDGVLVYVLEGEISSE